jgi:hypothetical protein
VLFYRDRAFWTYDLAARELRNLTSALPTSLRRRESDVNVVDPPVTPPGWTEDGTAVLLADTWDVWKVPVGASSQARAARITPDGKERGIRYRRAWKLDPEDEGLDLSTPLYLSASGERDKKGGLARLRPGAEHTELLLWEDAAFTRLLEAEQAPVLAFSKETALEYPTSGSPISTCRRDVGSPRPGSSATVCSGLRGGCCSTTSAPRASRCRRRSSSPPATSRAAAIPPSSGSTSA